MKRRQQKRREKKYTKKYEVKKDWPKNDTDSILKFFFSMQWTRFIHYKQQ